MCTVFDDKSKNRPEDTISYGPENDVISKSELSHQEFHFLHGILHADTQSI